VSRFGPKLAGAGGFINITQNSRTVIFVGTFTAGGLKIAVQDGQLEILKEGRARKFVNQVEQITFSGPYAAASDQNVLYVTERCVFRLTTQGLELIEVAPGVDLERDILGQMDFRPIVNHPVAMDARIFRPSRCSSRTACSPSGWSIAWCTTRRDRPCSTIFTDCRCVPGKTWRTFASRPSGCASHWAGRSPWWSTMTIFIDENVVDDYARMVEALSQKYYTHVSRYTTSAFMRLKLGEALESRGLAAHIFETRGEALEAARAP